MRVIKYAAPTSVEEAVAILEEYGEDARILAGGTDLIVQVREYARDVEVMVDGKGIEELTRIEIKADGSLTLGAAVPCYQIAGSAGIVAGFPGFIDAVSINRRDGHTGASVGGREPV